MGYHLRGLNISVYAAWLWGAVVLFCCQLPWVRRCLGHSWDAPLGVAFSEFPEAFTEEGRRTPGVGWSTPDRIQEWIKGEGKHNSRAVSSPLVPTPPPGSQAGAVPSALGWVTFFRFRPQRQEKNNWFFHSSLSLAWIFPFIQVTQNDMVNIEHTMPSHHYFIPRFFKIYSSTTILSLLLKTQNFLHDYLVLINSVTSTFYYRTLA